MSSELAERTTQVVLASERALTSGEIAVRLRHPRPEVEAALEDLRDEPRILVRAWPMADPHFGADQIVVAARAPESSDPAAMQAAEERCRKAFDEILRDFLASHRCV